MTNDHLTMLLSGIQEDIREVKQEVKAVDAKIEKLGNGWAQNLKECQHHSEIVHDQMSKKTNDIEKLMERMQGCAEGKKQYGTATILISNIIVLAVFTIIAAFIQRGW